MQCSEELLKPHIQYNSVLFVTMNIVRWISRYLFLLT